MTPTTETSTAAPVRLNRLRLGAYATLQLPLAMSALPIVVTVAHFYGKHVFAGVAGILSILGIVFFVTRLVDAIQDPLIGFVSDRLTHFRNGRLLMAIASVPFLGAGFYAIFAPPQLDHVPGSPKPFRMPAMAGGAREALHPMPLEIIPPERAPVPRFAPRA